MTLGVEWVRQVGGTQELVVASDSRLSGGQAWDGNAKIMLLPRSDAVLSFREINGQISKTAQLTENARPNLLGGNA